MLTLTISTRDQKKKPAALRAAGVLPAVLYGRKESATPVAVALADFEKVWNEAGESSVITLAGAGEPKEALIQDVALDPLTDRPVHADFYVIEKGKKLLVSVPLAFTGVAPAVKDKGGVLIKVLHEIEVEALPKNLPHEIVVDLSALAELDAHIAVADVKLPEGVVATANPADIVASVAAQKEESEEPAEIDMSKIEVAGEKEKKEKEAEESEGENKEGK